MPAVQLARLPLATVNQQFHRLALELLVVSFLNLLFLHGFSLFTLSFRVRKIRGGSDLDQLSKRIKTLEEDLALILSLPGPIANQILANASQVGNSAYDQMRVQKCADLVKRYDMG